MMVDWANLDQDLVVAIANRLESLKDFGVFREVCKSWGSTAIKKEFADRLAHQSPFLMILANEDTSDSEVYNLGKGMFHKIELPQVQKKQCYYSSVGWLMSISEDLKVNLLNPLSRRRIELPGINKINNIKNGELVFSKWNYYYAIIKKFVLSSSPFWTSDFIVMVIYISGGWGFWRPGEGKWTSRWENIIDVTCYKGQFYAMDFYGNILVCDIGDPKQAKTRIVIPNLPIFDSVSGCCDENVYLVESGGTLLVVLQFGVEFGQTTKFQVFKVPFNSGNVWSRSDLQINNLGSRAIFLELHGSSFSIEASKNNGSGCKANCIYFTDVLSTHSNPRRMSLMSWFNMDDEKMEQGYLKRRGSQLWIQPSF